MSLPIGQVIGLLSDNLRLRGSVFPIPSRRVTGWSRGSTCPKADQPCSTPDRCTS